MEMKRKILLIEDEPGLRITLGDRLSSEGYGIEAAADGDAGFERASSEGFDLIILDLMLPGKGGLDICRDLRQQGLGTPILMLTARDQTVDKVLGLKIGADDYLTKPFDPRELLARIKSVLRRYQRRPATDTPLATPAEAPRRMAFGHCLLDLDSRELLGPQGESIPLTAAEFDLLQVFAERPNRTLSRDQLLSLTQNREWDPYDRSIDIRIARLRKKIEANPDKPQTIKTVRGVGYLFVPGKS